MPPDYGTFTLHYNDTLFTVHPELEPNLIGTGKFFVYGINEQYGSFYFTIDQDENLIWFAERLPLFVGRDVIDFIGDQIERRAQ